MPDEIFIPFNRPTLQGREHQYMMEAIERGHLSGDGYFTKKCNKFLETHLAAKKTLLTTSCTHALEIAALLLDILPGDEIILPSFTFVSTVNAFALRGATPIFADVRPDTLNLDEAQLESLITPRTRAIVVVHYAGVGCEMNSIMEIATRHGVAVIEDNAHGLFGKYHGQPLGSFGCIATQSFHETKNFTCGEGGALVINDDKYIERAEIIREKGTDRSRFFRGQVDKYTWVDLGSSYLPSDLLAAFLFAQLEMFEQVQQKRKDIWSFYYENLQGWSEQYEVKLPSIPLHCEQAYHMFYIIMPSLDARQAFIQHMRSHQIMSVFHYLPLHLSEMGQRLGGASAYCPVTEIVSDRLVRLPFFNGLNHADQARVIQTIQRFDPTEIV